ncbi:chloride channel CLIC-like protein 1 [Acanthaster planci]|uniref:Chloride channel CLIC-like protein 1 n=1 Tax=Acanthaster planci TaxID=133434 RepID=A0A8B7YBU9_ACAPL|nr:chloride channel CLIC-like protein 1 [Acanthaster planci]
MASPNMLLCSLAIVLLGMATTLVSRSEGQEEAPELDPVGEEFPSQGHLDHTDMLNFDPVSRTMRGSGGINKVKSCKKELQTCHDNLADCKVVYDKPVNSEDSMESPCKLEQMFFRRFAKHFINLLISEADVGEDSPLVAEVRVELSSYRWNKLRQFVQQKGKVKLVDAHDFMVDMLMSVRHDNVTEKPGLLERMTEMDPRDITFYALLLILGVVVIIYESNTQASWWKQLCAVMMVMFFISVCWNWVYLYKKELAVRISTMHKGQDMPPECMPDKMTWLDSIKEALRKQLTFKKDPCDVYHENVLVDPIYEVPPTRAIVHTLSTMFMEPLKTLGKQVSSFHRELLQDLPYAAWLPALLTVYLSLAVVCVLMCYCPQLAHRRDRGAWERVRELEAQLRERDAVNHRQGRLEEFEPRREDQVAPPPPMPALNLIINNRPAEDILAGQPQHQMHPEEPLAVERPPARPRRRPHVSSESDAVQDHPQRQPLNLGSRSADSAPYQGDVSGDDDSSDEADGRQGQRPRAPDEKYGTRRTEIQGQPVECPNSELDSMEERSTVKPKPKVQGLSGTKPRQKVRVDKMASKGDSHPDGGRLGKKGTAGGAGPKAKNRMEKPKPGEVPAENMSASVTPASSTDSEPFSASVPGLDSPSSVSVIEGDSTPASGGSVDGDSHLRSLGTSLSGSIDIIEPLGATGGAEGEKNEEGNDSDEFEVLSREQCQDEPMK